MFDNAARQKFPEASLMLLAAAVCAAVDASHIASAAGVSEQVPGGGYTPPLAAAVDGFQHAWPTLSAIAAAVMIIYIGLSLPHATLRRYLYPAHTLVGIPLTGIVVCGCTLSSEYLSTTVLLLLAALLFRQLYACFGREMIVPHLFPAMVCLGCMPLLYAPMTAFVVLLLPFVVLYRLSLRSCVAAVTGALLPVFVVSYLRWAGGGDFGATAYELWRAMLAPSGFDVEAYITIPRLVLFFMIMFTTISSIILYRSNRFAVGLAARKIWGFSIVVVVLAAALFSVLPSSTQLSITVVAFLSSMLMPMFFVRMANYISSLLYWLMIAAAVWSVCA